MRDVVCAVKPYVLDGTRHIVHNNLRYNIIVLVWHLNLT